MIRTIIYIIGILLVVFAFASCTKRKAETELPKPDEPELITTVRIKAVAADNGQDISYFSYKVENGFHGTGQVSFHVDTIKLRANTTYTIEMFVLNEKKSPTVDVTPEIIEERNAHLFYYTGTPNEGSGSIEVTDRDKDYNGQDFGRICKWHTRPAGSGQMKIELIHGPRNKEASDRSSIAGATDAETSFPVLLYK